MTTSPFRNNKNFQIGFALTLATALYLVINSLVTGKNAFFLQLNTDLGPIADTFFRYWTNLGDGLVWIAIAILFFIYRKNKFPLLIAAILVSTLITQLTKNYVFPEEPRPTAAIADINAIHTVPGVELHTAYSFPSGHTGTAFTIFLLACLLMKKRWVVPVGFVYALLAGYSRIYLAQHFPLDVGAGMITALCTVLISFFIQERWERKSHTDGDVFPHQP